MDQRELIKDIDEKANITQKARPPRRCVLKDILMRRDLLEFEALFSSRTVLQIVGCDDDDGYASATISIRREVHSVAVGEAVYVCSCFFQPSTREQLGRRLHSNSHAFRQDLFAVDWVEVAKAS
jgi:hypothetical protein